MMIHSYRSRIEFVAVYLLIMNEFSSISGKISKQYFVAQDLVKKQTKKKKRNKVAP